MPGLVLYLPFRPARKSPSLQLRNANDNDFATQPTKNLTFPPTANDIALDWKSSISGADLFALEAECLVLVHKRLLFQQARSSAAPIREQLKMA